MRRTARTLVTIAIASVAFAATAQEGAKPILPASGMTGADVLNDPRANAHNICWDLGTPVASDWLAERDDGYRRGDFQRYLLDETATGWRWLRREGDRTRDLRGSNDDGAVSGVPYAELEVDMTASTPWARLTVESALRTGRARFEWTAPPQRLCMADGLELSATVEILDGAPGSQKMFFVLPLTPELAAAEEESVRACRPGAAAEIDSEYELTADLARCERELFHLVPGAPWMLMVSLPESFYVIYPYEPDIGRRR